MTRDEYKAGLRFLAVRFETFVIDPKKDPEKEEAWFNDMQSLPGDEWKLCIEMIALEEKQWWPGYNLTAMVGERLSRVRAVMADKRRVKAEEKERKALPAMSDDERRKGMREGMAKVHAIIGNKKMIGEKE